MGWIEIDPRELRVADIIRFDLWCTLIDDAGNTVMKAPKPGCRPEPRKTAVTMVGRILNCGTDVFRDFADAVAFERTNTGRTPDGTVIPTRVSVVLHKEMKRLFRSAEHPHFVNNCDGVLHVRELLVAAAGGDENDEAALDRLAACVFPNDLDGVPRDQGGRPRRLGRDRAIRAFTNEKLAPYEACIRQLDGRIQIPPDATYDWVIKR